MGEQAVPAVGNLDRTRAGFAGVVAVGVSLGIGELLAGLLEGVASPISSIGSVIVDRAPAAMKDFAIAAFGTADKAALGIGTAIIALVIGGAVGRIAARRFGTAVWWFIGFGLLGLIAALAQPLVNGGLSVLATIVSTGAGIGALRRLLDLLEPPLEEPTDGRVGDAARRRFLGGAVGLGVGALGAGALGRSLLQTGKGPVDVGDLALPTPLDTVAAPAAGQSLAVPGLTPIVVPNTDFYRIDTALVVPRVDATNWTMTVHGMVDRELELNLADLYDRDIIERYVTIACVSNEVGDDLVGNAKWGGVRLTDVLEEAGIQDGASQIVGRSVDGWTAGFPTDLAFDGRDPLIALFMNDEPLPARHGFPARLIVPGLYGYVSATKWLSEIELTTWDAFDGYWIPRGWAKEGPIKTQSRVDVPRPGDTFAAGETFTMAGVAWAPTRGIARVEVQVNDLDWVEAEVTSPLSDAAWVQWRAEVALPVVGQHEVRVRATDGNGETQTAERVPPRPDGATGHHTVRIRAN